MDTILKRLGLWLVVLVFALVFVYARITHVPKPSVEETATSTPAAAFVSPESGPLDGHTVTVSMRERKIKLSTDISIQYPELTSVGKAPGVTWINETLKNFIDERVQHILTMAAGHHERAALIAIEAKTQLPYVGGQSAYLEITSQVSRPQFAPNLLSVGFNERYDAALAHPQKSGHSFTFDLRTGERISLDDLFVPDGSYSDAVVAYLNSTSSTIPRTTFPCCAIDRIKPSTAFLITDAGLKFLFDQGDRLGNIPVTEKIIPWDVVRPFISPTGPLAGLLL